MKLGQVYNKIPKNGIRGGWVMPMPDMTKSQLNNDSVSTILMPNEMVIPVKYTKMVSDYLKKKNISFGNFNTKK